MHAIQCQRKSGSSTIRPLMAVSILVVVCSFLFFSAGVARAAGTARMAPVNPEFLEGQSEREAALAAGESALKTTADGHRLGYGPSPVDYSYLKEPASESEASLEAAAYPTAYDLRDHGKLTPIRNQADCGSCWSFAAYGSLESCLLTGKQTDFSENHMIDMHGFDWGPCLKGNFDIATAYLARWGGPVPEKSYPYQYLLASTALPATKTALANPYHVQNVEMFALTQNNVKAAVQKYGAVGICFYYGSSYYNSSSYGYYCAASGTGTNHCVAIVGWDNNYSKSNFNNTPSGKGAYLVRNSWGTAWGDKGYFWISYYDKSLASNAYAFNNAEATTNYNTIYQYDTLGMTSGYGYSGSTAGWMANIFKATPLGTKIAAVSFYAPVNNTSYAVYVYNKVTVSGSSDSPVVAPRSGTLVASKSGKVTAGYHTVKFSTVGKVTSGSNFSVVVKLTTPGYTYPIPLEYPWSNYSSRACAIPGQSYVSSNGSSWADIQAQYANTNVCVKAFANK